MAKKINYFDYGYVRCSAVSPQLYLAKPMKNAEKVIKIAKEESEKQSLIVLFPELGLTGYTIEDLFFSEQMVLESRKALEFVIKKSVNIESILVIGHPYQSYDGKFYNCASVIHKGKLLAMIPKCYLPSYNEFYEARFWTSGIGVDLDINDFGQSFKLAPQQLINFKNKVILGVEICEDLWAVSQPSTNMAINGANLIVNLSASNELVGKSEYRRDLVIQQSARLNCGYLYASANALESTKDVVFSGSCLAAENGTLMAEGERFSFEDKVTVVEFDMQKLSAERRRNTTFRNSMKQNTINVINLDIKSEYALNALERTYSPNPFIPSNPATLVERSEEIIQIQSTGLARKILSTNNSKIIIGLSGGLDSTLTMLVSLEAMKKLGRPASDIICISMPGFGTSQRTRSQSENLAKASGVTFQEIDITATVKSHFKDIGHNENDYSNTYENAQARERTQILLDLGNKNNAILVAGSDLSELFCGWMSYGGDHLFHYGTNVSVPKTLVQHLIKFYKDHKTTDQNFKNVLQAVLETKISPELLPLGKDGGIEQSTEEVLGPYSVIDFMMFHFLRNSFTMEKIIHLASRSFKGVYTEEQLSHWINSAFTRFKRSQFKRTMAAPGPKLGSCSLSPRGDARYCDEME